MYKQYQPVVEATRGSVVESVHFGAVAVVDSEGRLIASYGSPEAVSCLRSSSKPIQILPFVEDGGVEKFGITEKELAVMCASHSGTDEHVAVVDGIQKKIGVAESDLLCGTHPAIDKETAKAMILRGETPTPLRHNCSGKHTGMLANALLHDLSIENYIDADHPLQKLLLKTFAEMCDLEPEDVKLGIDGCSVPVFAVPLFNAAYAFARIADPVSLAENRAEACRKISQAMMHHPFMVAGPNRFDTALMEAAAGSVFCKGGAEGYHCIGIMPNMIDGHSHGLGIAIKVADGDAAGRAIALTAVETLRQLGVLNNEMLAGLANFDRRPIYNWRHFEVGELRPCFTLEFNH